MNINEPKKPKNDIIVTCANCENNFILAPPLFALWSTY